MEVLCEYNFFRVFSPFLKFILLFKVYGNINFSVDLNCLFFLGRRLTEWAGLHWREPFHWASGITWISRHSTCREVLCVARINSTLNSGMGLRGKHSLVTSDIGICLQPVSWGTYRTSAFGFLLNKDTFSLTSSPFDYFFISFHFPWLNNFSWLWKKEPCWCWFK